MREYGGKPVIEHGEFREATVVEVNSECEVVARKYYKNEFEEKQAGDYVADIDIIPVVIESKPNAQMEELTRQIQSEDFVVDESVVDLIERLRS